VILGDRRQNNIKLCRNAILVLILGIVLVLYGPAVIAGEGPVPAPQADQAEQLPVFAVSKPFGVVAGCSRILPVEDVVRVAVANPNIADVVVVSKAELIINGKSLGRTILYVWDSMGRTGYDVRVLEDNEGLLEEISEVIGLPELELRFAKSTLLLEGACKTDDEYERADKIAKAYADKVLNLITVLDPKIPEPPPTIDRCEVEAGIGIDGVTVRVVKDAVILEGLVDKASDAERAESFAKLYTSKVLNFIDVPAPPAPEDEENKEGVQEVEDSPEDTSLGHKAAEADIEAVETEDAPFGDSDEELRDKIIAALRDPSIEVMVVDGTALLEGEVPDEHNKVRAEAVAKLYAQKVVSVVRVVKAEAQPPPAPPLPPSELPKAAPEVPLEDKVADYIGLPDVAVRSVGGRLLLEGDVDSQNDLERVERIASLFSQDVVNLVAVRNPYQVLLQVQVVEINRGALKNLGITWGSVIDGALSAGSFMFGEWTSPLGLGLGGRGPEEVWQARLPIGSIVEELWRLSPIRAVLDTLVSEDLAQVLAAPSLLTLSGEEADFLVGGEIPVYMGQMDGRAVFEWRPYGVKLKMLPSVDTKGRIVLDIEPEVSSLDWSNALDTGIATIPALRMRKASTHLIVEDDVTIAVGGLIQNTEAKIVKKLPILGDIPIIGGLFKSERFEKGESELVILITPKVVRIGERITREQILDCDLRGVSEIGVPGK
jgi:pilus assembly protein CpaC